jgi:hypothetical protein
MNDFSPNNEGGAAPLHVFTHHGIIGHETTQGGEPGGISSFNKEDDIMADEDLDCNRLSNLETTEHLNNASTNKNLYFGGASLLAPASKLNMIKSPSA